MEATCVLSQSLATGSLELAGNSGRALSFCRHRLPSAVNLWISTHAFHLKNVTVPGESCWVTSYQNNFIISKLHYPQEALERKDERRKYVLNLHIFISPCNTFLKCILNIFSRAIRDSCKMERHVQISPVPSMQSLSHDQLDPPERTFSTTDGPTLTLHCHQSSEFTLDSVLAF